ncbi:MAG: hypothetical protein ACR2RA_26495 [Geminicoccaceae bacterium]
MAGKDQPSGISIIEDMARKHHSVGPSILPWKKLSKEARKRLMERMEAAVGVIPDELHLKAGTFSATIETGGCRDGVLDEHKRAKKSAIYGS